MASFTSQEETLLLAFNSPQEINTLREELTYFYPSSWGKEIQPAAWTSLCPSSSLLLESLTRFDGKDNIIAFSSAFTKLCGQAEDNTLVASSLRALLHRLSSRAHPEHSSHQQWSHTEGSHLPTLGIEVFIFSLPDSSIFWGTGNTDR